MKRKLTLKQRLRTRLVRYVMSLVKREHDSQSICSWVQACNEYDTLLTGKTTDEQEEYIMQVVRWCERSCFPAMFTD